MCCCRPVQWFCTLNKCGVKAQDRNAVSGVHRVYVLFLFNFPFIVLVKGWELSILGQQHFFCGSYMSFCLSTSIVQRFCLHLHACIHHRTAVNMYCTGLCTEIITCYIWILTHSTPRDIISNICLQHSSQVCLHIKQRR